MKLEEFNRLDKNLARRELFACCGCTSWSERLMEKFPFASIEDMKINSDKIWFSCTKIDWLEAFTHHPQIGEKIESKQSDEKKIAWAKDEQSGVNSNDKESLDELTRLNKEYKNKFGFIFIIYATGKTSAEVISHLKDRIDNDYDKELHVAATEQNKITHLRIDKLFS